jgi:lipopolysaccharide transport system ATP-binding protein
MNDDFLVKANSVSKKFCVNFKRSLWYGVQDILSEFSFNHNAYNRLLRKHEFWAVGNVSFQLQRGNCLGLIGANGAGKSTLLKLLNGLIKPDLGKIEMKGRVCALIELGAGFNPILSGRENIFINGAVLGFSKAEIKRKFDEIVDFSELNDFIDMPVQSYSSGMKVRLGFSIAAQFEPDVLLIDEVLAVGDIGFRSKCFNAINKISQNAAVIFVSHVMPQVARICDEVLLLGKGKTLYHGGDVSRGISQYYASFSKEPLLITGSGRAQISNLRIFSNSEYQFKNDRLIINYLDDLVLEIELSADQSFEILNLNIAIFDKELRGVAQICTLNSGFTIINDRDNISLRITMSDINFNPGIYSISVALVDKDWGETLVSHHFALEFQVIGEFHGYTPVQLQADWERIV